MIRRLIVLTIVTTCALPAASAFAAVKAGAGCTQPGKISGSFKCTKVKGKFVWIKQTKTTPVTNATINSLPQVPEEIISASKAQSGLKCSSTVDAFTLAGPVRCIAGRWSLVEYENDSVATRAFRSVLQRYNSRPPKELTLDFRIDANTPAWKSSIELAMKATARFWGISNEQEPPIPVIMAGKISRIVEMAESFQLPLGWLEEKNPRRDDSYCNEAGFMSTTTDQPIWFYYCFHVDAPTNPGFLQVAPHEYTHFAQYILLERKGSSGVPWLSEGLASFLGSALGPMTGMGNDIRSGWVKQLEEGDEAFGTFADQKSTSLPLPIWQQVYPQSALALEAMAALYGIDGIETVYKEIASAPRGGPDGVDWALRKVTSVGVSEWTALLGQYVKAIESPNPWSLQELQRQASAVGAKV